ncbi:nucleoside diphosphate kinase regulator [Stutzerimonas kirkiae]|uniref:Nucleoside diphosphate kinase regulator n=1 Tax=Stutzerimonas kirkiae TaxID=2211392 RepID=A0A4Q9R5G0_9GAMM|nr:nucleoside diphosphate kinase regulator [Stutzerimonas kirkiae]TBU95761.1 nucleoside diphosphate kinase regulator [Stutzerimonas kirkiae]TBV02752.1 nucleoside diphosphate kinase regulator [Stutzerimonas kirkiae]TBV03210.1 nucleoside diphosphate kinase regulator [Stutzerimonas kirkiae]TBV13265.1 nucleoside diphosphate kinase regulator [Stutzerimonas kirkiae]
MSSTPAIIITEVDLQRLERLLDSLDEYGPAAEALEQELSRAQVVQRSEMPAGVVTMNSRVHCRDEGSGKDYHLTLVYPQQAGKDGTVSVLAPVGTALLGLSVGQHIDWPTPAGKVIRLALLAVEYQPEAAGDPER